MVAKQAKSRVLASQGGVPLFDNPVHVGTPNLGNREDFIDRVREILDRNWLTNAGPVVKELEDTICTITGSRHCIAMCNATTALEIAIRALDLQGEVLVPSMTFVATAHALQWQQITPIFCDIDPQSHQIDPAKIDRMITPKTTGIIAVNLWGRPCQIESLQAIATTHNLKLIFDSAHAFGVSYKNTMIGGFGDAEIFSFHATKFINCMEGGAVLTNDDELAKSIRLMKNFGFVGRDQVEYIGINGKMNEIQAAMGLTSIQSMPAFVEHNFTIYQTYVEGLASCPGVRLLPYDLSEINNFQYIVLEIDEQQSHIERDQLMRILQSENVDARRYFYPGCHRMEPYRSHAPHAHLLLNETEKLLQRVLVLPTGTSVSTEDTKKICELIQDVVYASRLPQDLISDLNL